MKNQLITVVGKIINFEPKNGDFFTMSEINHIMKSKEVFSNPIDGTNYTYFFKKESKNNKIINEKALDILQGMSTLIECVIGDILIVNNKFLKK